MFGSSLRGTGLYSREIFPGSFAKLCWCWCFREGWSWEQLWVWPGRWEKPASNPKAAEGWLPAEACQSSDQTGAAVKVASIIPAEQNVGLSPSLPNAPARKAQKQELGGKVPLSKEKDVASSSSSCTTRILQQGKVMWPRVMVCCSCKCGLPSCCFGDMLHHSAASQEQFINNSFA